MIADSDAKYHPLSTHSALSIACFTLSVRTCPYFPYVIATIDLAEPEP